MRQAERVIYKSDFEVSILHFVERNPHMLLSINYLASIMIFIGTLHLLFGTW